ncbi:MAG TPA: ADP-ribosylglycohydrolase family protein [Sedimentisphaerales bacterium]|nr:ADP-ribosylglycohydrolase family protein [Sedimentisphaerales bacterium]HNU29586.1 ADP-ribosylglycohydrolase family protein [Sedimentisphaerales bacterium]
MSRSLFLGVVMMAVLIPCAGCQRLRENRLRVGPSQTRQISVAQYVDKMKAGWIGQMAGVGWGGPTEFQYQGAIIPQDKMPAWQPNLVNQFQQDDIYVEMTFLRTLEVHGFDVSIRQAGIDFANSGYPLWHANRAGRDNLRAGIAPPDSGHPKFNSHADDIDYQIEADFAGLIAPGMPNVAIQLGEIFGRLMNYGDGLYGGQFVGGCYAEAFFESDIVKVVEAGLRCVPEGSQYHECISDVLKWHKQYPNDWAKTWQLVNEKYHLNPQYRRFSCSGPASEFNIDAKINGAYIVMGLLYGDGDPDKTIAISTRCGQDSDCNPSNAAGILFTTMGCESLPEKFKLALDPTGKFSHTPYNFPTLIEVCEKLVRQAVVNCGGKIATDTQGAECFVIPRQKPNPTPLEQCWEPGPIASSRYTEEEMAQITAESGVDLSKAITEFAPGWKIAKCGEDMEPGLRDEVRGRKNVLVTHPLSRTVGCVLTRTVTLPPDKKSSLKLVVGHDARGDWDLIVRADGEQLLRKTIGPDTTTMGWAELSVSLSQFAGKSVKLELVNEPTDWRFEAAFWSKIAVVSE